MALAGVEFWKRCRRWTWARTQFGCWQWTCLRRTMVAAAFELCVCALMCAWHWVGVGGCVSVQ